MSNENKANLIGLLSLGASADLTDKLLPVLEGHDDFEVALMLRLALMKPKEEAEPKIAYEDLLTQKGQKYLKAIKVAV